MVRVQKFFTKPSLTKQEFKKECDLGLTLKRFAKSPEGKVAIQNMQGYAENTHFGDVAVIPDFRAYRDQINQANASFMRLPAIVRRRFNNDAAEFLDFASNPANKDELRFLGLLKPVPPAGKGGSVPPVVDSSTTKAVP